ncbi:MAG: phage holin family protein [Mollicutes bacterium]|nr:phage holin family protein [Mollicutes bacterium]
MTKEKLKVKKITNRNPVIKEPMRTKNDWLTFVIKLVINTVVILLADKIFASMSVDGFWYAMLTAVVIAFLNQYIRPFLVFLSLPLTIVTFGLFYPFINVIILKLASLLLGSHFQISGIFIPLIISLFISFMNYLLEKLVFGDKK